MSVRPTLRMMRDPALLIASGFGAGLSPIAPGTLGSAVALLPYLALRSAEPWWLWACIVVTFAIGVRTASHAIRVLEREDPPLVVLDEWVGQWITLGLIDAMVSASPAVFGAPPSWLLVVTGFIAFRACDIAKPWPASLADRRLGGGFGAMF
ncbi:MAG TPA: phosphatidylglycerophosphatase A, partial [Xanthomonadales bacterium]|nr:phosphatidylglycerophosphatase A [Xanthomonadales bacterium]